MSNFKHHVMAGHIGRQAVFVTVNWDGKRLSITGVTGPKSNGDCAGSCGQNVGDLRDPRFNACDGVNASRLADIWERWHLNDMTAGSPAQSAFLRANPITDRMNHYVKACEALAAAGLNPDPNHEHNGKPYTYGSAWLREDVPADVIDFLRGLPTSDALPTRWAR